MLNLPISRFMRLIITSTNTLKKQKKKPKKTNKLTSEKIFKYLINENEKFDHLYL